MSFWGTFEEFTIIFLLFVLPSISAGSLLASMLYENHKKILKDVRTISILVIVVFIIGYFLSIGSGRFYLSDLFWLLVLFLLAGFIAVLIRFFIREDWYPRFLFSIGIFIVLFSFLSYFFTFLYIVSASIDFIIHEMGYLSRFEAFYKYFLPWLLRISALLMYGLLSATIGYSLWKEKIDRFYTSIKIEVYILLFFVASGIVHMFIFGRRIGI